MGFRSITAQMEKAYPAEISAWKPEYDADPACSLKYPFASFCKISKDTNSTIAILGDSQANRLFWGLDYRYKDTRENIVMLRISSTPPLLGIKVEKSWAPIFIELAKNYKPIIESVANDPKIHTVVLAGLWHWYFTGYKFADHTRNTASNTFASTDFPNLTDQKLILKIGLDKTIKYLEDHGKKVIFVKQIPLLNFPITKCLKRPYSINWSTFNCTTSAKDYRQYQSEYMESIE